MSKEYKLELKLSEELLEKVNGNISIYVEYDESDEGCKCEECGCNENWQEVEEGFEVYGCVEDRAVDVDTVKEKNRQVLLEYKTRLFDGYAESFDSEVEDFESRLRDVGLI